MGCEQVVGDVRLMSSISNPVEVRSASSIALTALVTRTHSSDTLPSPTTTAITRELLPIIAVREHMSSIMGLVDVPKVH